LGDFLFGQKLDSLAKRIAKRKPNDAWNQPFTLYRHTVFFSIASDFCDLFRFKCRMALLLFSTSDMQLDISCFVPKIAICFELLGLFYFGYFGACQAKIPKIHSHLITNNKLVKIIPFE
jgi:hypothetical protein